VAGSASAGNTDNQSINLVGNILTLGNGTGADTTADLSVYLDNTDTQTISLGGTILSILGGNTADLASIIDWNNLLNIPADIADGDDDTTYTNVSEFTNDAGYLTSETDNQNISGSGLSGDTLTIGIEDGTNETVDFSQYALDTDLHSALTFANVDASSNNYLTISGQTITRNLINLANHITGILGISNGGTGASTASGARTNLGLVIGTDVQSYNADTSFLGQTIETGEITDGTITAADLNTSVAGNGLTGGAGTALTIDTTTTGTTAITSSNSGLETVSSGVRLLGGCSDGEYLS